MASSLTLLSLCEGHYHGLLINERNCYIQSEVLSRSQIFLQRPVILHYCSYPFNHIINLHVTSFNETVDTVMICPYDIIFLSDIFCPRSYSMYYKVMSVNTYMLFIFQAFASCRLFVLTAKVPTRVSLFFTVFCYLRLVTQNLIKEKNSHNEMTRHDIINLVNILDHGTG